MAARDIKKNFNVFVDGRNYAGQTDEITPPALSMKTEEFRAGGMNGPLKLDMGMELMDCDFSLSAYDANVLALLGIKAGATLDVPLVFREVLEAYDGTVTPVQHVMRGRVTKMDPGATKPGEKSTLKVEMNLNYYKLLHGTRVITEIDVEGMIQIVDGTDQLALQRAALGM